MATRVMRASLLLASQHVSPFTAPAVTNVQSFHFPTMRCYRGAGNLPATCRDCFGQRGLARPAARGRKSVLVIHHIWSGDTSTKHRDASCFG